MKIALALLALSVCAGCAPYYDHDYADGYYAPGRYYGAPRRYYKPRTYYHRTKYYDRRRRDDDYRHIATVPHVRNEGRGRPLSERYDNRDCHATRDGRVKCYD